MSLADSPNSVPFADLTSASLWAAGMSAADAAAFSMSDADGIMDDFPMQPMQTYDESCISSPIHSNGNLPSLPGNIESSDDIACRKRPLNQPPNSTLSSCPSVALPLLKRTKVEFDFPTEPCTPISSRTLSSASESSFPRRHAVHLVNHNQAVPGMQYLEFPVPIISSPTSPSPSLCTDEAGDDDDIQKSVPLMFTQGDAEVVAGAICRPSKKQSARRRAFRRVALNKARAKKECLLANRCSMEGKNDGVGNYDGCGDGNEMFCGSTGNLTSGCAGEPTDKKAARAIRNREAAMKSRVEAKQKMRKLQEENQCLSNKVLNLSKENERLSAHLKTLLEQTLGVSVGEGQEVKHVLNMLVQLKASRG